MSSLPFPKFLNIQAKRLGNGTIFSFDFTYTVKGSAHELSLSLRGAFLGNLIFIQILGRLLRRILIQIPHE